MKLSVKNIPILPIIFSLFIGGSFLLFFQKVRYNIIVVGVLAGFQFDYVQINDFLFAIAFIVFSGFIVFCFIIIFIEKGTFRLLLSGNIKNIFNKHRKIDLFLFGVSSLLIGYVLYEYFVLPTFIDYEYIEKRIYQDHILNSSNVFLDLLEKTVKYSALESGYRPRILSSFLFVLDTNLMIMLNKYMGGVANFPLNIVALFFLVLVIYALVMLLFPNIPKSLCLLCSTFSLSFCYIQSTLGHMIRSAKLFVPVCCLFLFYIFIKELKEEPYNQKKKEVTKNIAIGSIVFLSLLIDEQIIFLFLFLFVLSFIVKFILKKKIDRILIIFSVCCCLYLLWFFILGKLIIFGSLNVQLSNYHHLLLLESVKNPISIIKTIYVSYKVWSAGLSSLFISFHMIALLFIIMQFLIIGKKKYMESFICISVFLFSCLFTFLITSAQPFVYQLHNNYYMLGPLYLFLGNVLYGFSVIEFSSKKVFRVLSFSCIFIILYNAPKASDYYCYVIKEQYFQPVLNYLTQEDIEIIQFFKDHGIKKYILTHMQIVPPPLNLPF